MACAIGCDKSQVAIDCFTPEFKRLKARKPPPNFDKVTDLHLFPATDGSYCVFEQQCQVSRQHLINRNELKPIAGLKPVKDWRVFEFPNNPGFLVILNPFIDGFQRYWVSRCLQDFPSDEANVTNMTGQHEFDLPKIWHRFTQKSTFEKCDPLRKLRWTTLGYHYDWTSKEYSESRKAEFPMDVHLLSGYIAEALGFGQFRAEAAIVNYYHMDSTLAGHTDHSEIDLEAPLFSISFGQTAVFLLGGETKSVKPLALYLRSGDICVMSGLSRLAYHAVPRILPPWTTEEADRLKEAFDNSKHPVHAGDVYSISNANPACSEFLDTEKKPEWTVTSKSVAFDSKMSDDVDCAQAYTPENVEPILPNRINSDYSNRVPDGGNNVDGLFKSNRMFHHSSEYEGRLDKINSKILKAVECLDFKPFELYLSSSRINLNIRQVLPTGCNSLFAEKEEETVNHKKRLKTCNT